MFGLKDAENGRLIPAPASAAFRQSPHFDEGLVPVSSLLTSLTSSDWHVERLPLETQALVYSAFAIGTLYSYDASIIGPSPYTSFADLSSSSTGMDLREYGKRRRPAFEQMRELAMRAARKVDVWMEPTVDNAGTCNLLDIASRIGAPTNSPLHPNLKCRSLTTRRAPLRRSHESRRASHSPFSPRLHLPLQSPHLERRTPSRRSYPSCDPDNPPRRRCVRRYRHGNGHRVRFAGHEIRSRLAGLQPLSNELRALTDPTRLNLG